MDKVVVKNYKENFNPFEFEKIVISGTALKDFEYLNYLEKFNWIKNYNGKVIGICAGDQIISKIFGCRLIDNEIIGNRYIDYNGKKILAYFLILKIPILNENFEILAKIENIPVIFKLKGKGIYGFLFYPEVHNEDLLIKFVKNVNL